MNNKRVDAKDIIQIHAVIQDNEDTSLEIHTHGLTNYNHPELSIIAESIFYVSACRLLNTLAESIVNDGEYFQDGESCECGEWGLFKFENNVDSLTNIILRIVPMKLNCEVCEQ